MSGDTAPRTARLVGTYPPDDLAVIRADDPSGLQPARFGDSDQVQAGDVVLAMGNPLGLSGSVTQGIISATDRAVTEPAAASWRPGRGHATRRDPDQRTDQPGQQRRRAGQRLRTGDRHPDAGRGQPAKRRPGSGHRFRHPVQPGPRHRPQIIDSGHVTNSHRAALGAEVATVLGADARHPGGRGRRSHGHQRRSAERAGLRPGDVIKSAGPTQTPDTTALSQALAGARPGGRHHHHPRHPGPGRPARRSANCREADRPPRQMG